MYTIQLRSTASAISSIKFRYYSYFDDNQSSFMIGYSTLFAPKDSYAITESAIQGNATVAKVYGSFGSMYRDLVTCNKEWEELQELDVT